MCVTLITMLWQMQMRRGILDPETAPIFYRLFLFEDYGASFLFVAVLLGAMVPAAQTAGRAVSLALGRVPLAVALACSAALAIASVTIYHAHPLAMDESAPVMQSMAFASGRLLGQYPSALIDWLIYPPFQNYFIHVSRESGLVASAYWPGFALLLTPFTAIGAAWLCNPILGGLSIWVIQRLTRELTGSIEAAGCAVLFTIASAAFVINSISFYSMTAHLLCNGTFALLLLKPTPIRALVAGFIGGLALTLHNPIPHLLFAIPWAAWLTLRTDRLRLIAAAAAGYAPWVVIVGFGWYEVLQGLKPPGTDGMVAPGSLASALGMLGSVFSLPGGSQIIDRVIGLAKLWLWAAPALILMAGIGFWRHRRDGRFRWLLAGAVLTLVGYLFVPLSGGHGWGFRYFHSAWFVLPVLAAAALAPRSTDASKSEHPTGGLTGYSQAAALGGLLVMVPYFAWQVQSFISAHLAQAPVADHGSARVVIISPFMQYYAQDLVQNDPFLRQSTIRMASRGRPADARMMAEHFPDLVLLGKDYRGSVWGYEDPGERDRSSAQVAGDAAASRSR